MTCRTARNDNIGAGLVIAAAQAELRAAGQPDDWRTVAHLLAWRLILAGQAMTPGFSRMQPGEAVRAGKVRPTALGSEMEPNVTGESA